MAELELKGSSGHGRGRAGGEVRVGLRPAGTEVAWMDTGLEAWSGWRVMAVVGEI